MKDRCPEVPPNDFNNVTPVERKVIIRAAKSEESVIKVTFDSDKGENTEVGAHEILFTRVPKVPSQTCSRDHLSLNTSDWKGSQPFSECFCSVESVVGV